MARRTLLLIASILTAALGTALIWLYVQGADTRAQQNANLVPALYLTKNLNVGDSPASAVVTKYIPPDAAAGAVTSASQVGDRTLTIPAKEGSVLLQSMLGPPGSKTTRFPAGGAVSVTINDPNRVPADLKYGDYVDVVELTKNDASIVVSNVRVRSLGPNGDASNLGTAPAPAATNGAIPATIVGLDVNQPDALKIYRVVASGSPIAIYLHDRRSS